MTLRDMRRQFQERVAAEHYTKRLIALGIDWSWTYKTMCHSASVSPTINATERLPISLAVRNNFVGCTMQRAYLHWNLVDLPAQTLTTKQVD